MEYYFNLYKITSFYKKKKFAKQDVQFDPIPEHSLQG
jgi:hypothetical protein